MRYAELEQKDPDGFIIRITDDPDGLVFSTPETSMGFFFTEEELKQLIVELKQILTMDDEKETK